MPSLPNAQTINEDEALVNGVDASCGPTASYIAAGIVNDFQLTQGGLQQLVSDAEAAGTLNTGGQLFTTGPQWDLQQYGISSSVMSPANPTQLQSTLDNALAQNKPVVLGMANANQLTGEPAGLHGHFVTAVGTNNNGDYIISDPNLGEFTSNSLGQLFAAQPVAVTIPGKGGTGVPSNVTPTTVTGEGLSIFSVQLPDLSQGLETVIHDIFPFTQASNWMSNFLGRAFFALLGGTLFLVSFDYFLGTFNPQAPNMGPILRALKASAAKGREAEQSLQNKGEEIAKVAEVAAV